MPLVLEIEHLMGIAFAAQERGSEAPDWPPQPDRVFSALVASWAARGERPHERSALEWLERQEAPAIAASDHAARPAPESYVPPNDRLSPSGGAPWRTRRPRRFPAALPHDPTVRLVWAHAETPPHALDALDAMARDIVYVGHSASLTRCRFRLGDAPAQTRPAQRGVYPGRLRELERAFSAGQRPSPGVDLPPRPAPRPAAQAGRFSSSWLVFEITGDALDLRAAPLACKALIKAVMCGYGRAGLPVPEWVAGHAGTEPARAAHLAAVPLGFTGFTHADGSLLGFALVPPAERGDPFKDEDLIAALGTLLSAEDRALTLTLGRAGALRLAPTLDPDRASLDPRRYTRTARRWATATPLVLDRHIDPPRPERGDGDRYRREVEELIGRACLHAGLPAPLRVVAGKHAAPAGVPSATPSGSAPSWTGWRVPEAFASRRLVHAVLTFQELLAGPVLIGAGRFCGLGLCLPFDAAPG
jgi:CRISPR-associated protein Csb2